MPTKLISIRIPDELYDYLSDRAKSENRTISNMITTILSIDKIKSTPVKPIREGDRCYCPSCNSSVMNRICSRCGQFIDYD